MTKQASVGMGALVDDVRQTFQLLRALADQIHAGGGVNASMRAVMEVLQQSGPSTVPDIARNRHVSRQHIQQIVNELVALRLAEFRDNPRHKRSQLVAMTADGEAVFAAMQQEEVRPLDEIERYVGLSQISEARRILGLLNTALIQQIEEAKLND
jgi:DNA-binding MarR family transcriptional regulator